MNEKYPEKLIILPLENKVLLPSTILRLLIRGKQANELTKSYFLKDNKPSHGIYIACIPLKRLEPDQPQVSFFETDAVSQAPQVPLPSSTNLNPISTGLVSLKDRNRLMSFGCLGRIIRVQKSGTNLFDVFVEGLARFNLLSVSQNTPSMAFPHYWMAKVNYPIEKIVYSDQGQFKNLCQQFVSKMRDLQLPESLLTSLEKVVDSMQLSPLADMLVSLIETTFEERVEMLSTHGLQDRLSLAGNLLKRQLNVLQLSDSIGSGIDPKFTKRQREFYLRQQLEAAQHHTQAGTPAKNNTAKKSNDDDDELSELFQRLSTPDIPSEVKTVAQREIKRIKKLQPSSSEWAVSRNYLEWLADLPWTNASDVSLDIQRSKRQLDQDHFGLDHVKKRIIEYLSVIKIKGDLKAPILCLVGPPGVGKTSLGKSIATSLSREFHRISLGGVRDEADMRGHRRTYVGSMPGLIIQGLRKCKVNNPLFLLDEIDKLGYSPKSGDPAAALLEVLDPEQNTSFSDHYLNVPFDLSNVLFLATANSLDTIPGPLLDRMEVIEMEGYTFDEKLHIAKTHLIPKQVTMHGLGLDQFKLSDEAILYIAEHYTRESGVRNLERTLASVVRAKCVSLAHLQEKNKQDEYSAHVNIKDIQSILGNVKFEKEISERESYPGVVTGLAYSGTGGGILFVEASKMPGDGRLSLTGSLGNVIQESAKLALSWVKTNAYKLQLTTHPKEKLIEHDDIHIHFPSGSIPKDGPSAGVTLVCAIVSLYSGKSVPTTCAMTGEISLRGQVLPVGGIKEKIISAHRAGIKKIIIPLKNQQDVETDVPEIVRNEIQFCYARNIWQVLDAAFDYSLDHKSIEESHL